MVNYEIKTFKSILNKYKFIDSWFWGRYGINAYSGCEFACTYCDSRSEKYYLHDDFARTIYVKEDAPAMLDRRISRARTLLPDVVCLSGASDPYQPAEKEFQNTRGCLEVLAKHRYPVHVLTKSELVERDIDLLQQIGADSWATVSFTITCTQQELASFLEPAAPSPERRFSALTRLRKAGVQAGVNLIPCVPVLGDAPEQIARVVQRAAEAGAAYVLFGGGMTMRDRQADWYLGALQKRYPDAVASTLRAYDGQWSPEDGYSGQYAPSGNYLGGVHRSFSQAARHFGMATRISRFLPDDFRYHNYRIAEVFLNQSNLLRQQGKPWSNLYWAGQNIQNLKESTADIAARCELESIRNVTAEIARRVEKALQVACSQSP
jgi:DNA repair photolyase